MSELICDVCEEKLVVRWTDTHCVCVCCNCGLPYEIKRERGLETGRYSLAVKDEWLPIARKYWQETHNKVFPAACDMGVLPSRTETYSGATNSDITNWHEWLDKHESELPMKPETPTGGE